MAEGTCKGLIAWSRTFGSEGALIQVPAPMAEPADLPGAQSPLEASEPANPSPCVRSLPALLSLIGRLAPCRREPVVTTVPRPGPPKGLTAIRADWAPDARGEPATHAQAQIRVAGTRRRRILFLQAPEHAAVRCSRASARLSCCGSAHSCLSPHPGFYLILSPLSTPRPLSLERFLSSSYLSQAV